MTTERFSSRFVEVKGSQMHYLESGQGAPILFVHGIPTSSYLWRNIFSPVNELAHCIAIDLIGMGQSDKPEIDFTLFDHLAYFEAFIDALNLKDITLVMHGWGAVIGFAYARKHADKVKALAFYESVIKPDLNWKELSLPVQQLATLLKKPAANYRAVVEQNYFIDKLLPNLTVSKLDPLAIKQYRQPFLTPQSRKPLWQYVQDLPIGDTTSAVAQVLKENSQWLQCAEQPKLMLYGIPGFITTIAHVAWAKEHLKNISFAELENTLHFAQETTPDLFSSSLRKWYLSEIHTNLSEHV